MADIKILYKTYDELLEAYLRLEEKYDCFCDRLEWEEGWNPREED